MKPSAKKFISILAVGLVAVAIGYVSVLYFIAPRPTEKSFPSYTKAITGDPLQDHWIPDFLPKSAKNIYMRYGVDPTFQMLEFSFDQADKKIFLHEFVPLTESVARKKVMQKISSRPWRTTINDTAIVYVPKGHLGDHEQWAIYLIIDGRANHAWYTVN